MEVDIIQATSTNESTSRTSEAGSSNEPPLKRARQTHAQSDAPIFCNKKRAEEITQALAKMISLDLLPLSFAQGDGFHHFMSVVEPGYKIPCTETVKKRIDLLYESTKKMIKNELALASSVSGVSDCWTSRAQDSYLTLSANYLDSKWEPKTVCLATKATEERHTATNLCKEMKESLEEFGLQDKVF